MRDVMWLIVVVGILLLWGFDHFKNNAANSLAAKHASHQAEQIYLRGLSIKAMQKQMENLSSLRK
jgi:hypothetical protein